MKIALILIAALILRLININQSLWLDESVNVVYSQRHSFWDFVTLYSIGDFHPPLHFAIIWIWTHLFGTSEIIVRTPSIIFGLLTVWFTYLIGKKIFNKKTGLIAALILAFNPLHVYYSQEARMYSLSAFVVVFSYWAFLNFLEKKKYFFLIYSFSVALILYSEYLVYFALVSQLIYVVWQDRAKLFNFIKSMLLGSLIWSPWLYIFRFQFQMGQEAAASIRGWAKVVGGSDLKDVALIWIKPLIGRITFENKFIYALVVSAISLVYGLVILKTLKPLNKETKLLLTWTILPVVIAFFVSFFIPVMSYFRLLFLIPGIALILAFGLSKFSKNFQIILTSIIILFSIFCLSLYYLNPQFQRENWRDAIAYAKSQNAPIYFEDNNIPAPAQYYDCILNCFPALFNYPANTSSDLVNLQSLTSNQPKVYLFDYLVEVADPNRFVAKELEAAGFKNTETKNFDGVGFVYEYSK